MFYCTLFIEMFLSDSNFILNIIYECPAFLGSSILLIGATYFFKLSGTQLRKGMSGLFWTKYISGNFTNQSEGIKHFNKFVASASLCNIFKFTH